MTLHNVRGWAAGVAIAVLMSACATAGNKAAVVEQDPVAEKLDTFVEQDGSVRHEISNENVARLWQESNIMRRSGNLDAAKTKLQEAIAITPEDAALWSGAAELELQEESLLRAENYAAKSNSLAAIGNRPLRYRNWLIIQRAREGRGDLLGAREAETESTKLAR